MNTYVFFVWQTYFVFCINAKNLGNCTHMYNAHEVLSWQPHIFYICKLYFSFTLMIPQVFLVWHPYLFLQMAMKILLHFIKILHLAAIFVFSHLWAVMDSLVWQKYFLLLIYANNFGNCTQIYMYKILISMKC